jgi:hypothetical protein
MSDPIRNQRTGFQPEPEFVTIADTVSYQGPPPEANDGPELPLTPDEHRRGEISPTAARELLSALCMARRRLATLSKLMSYEETLIDEAVEQALKELRGD